MRIWDRKLWGVEFFTPRFREPLLLGSMWDDVVRERKDVYAGEPTRALLFQTRRDARAWCRKQLAEWAKNESTRDWKVTAVRVRETVALIE